MGKPTALKNLKLTAAQKKRLVALARQDPAVKKEVVRKRRHTIAHALAGSRSFRAKAKRAGIIP
jgi:hypothetical protein